MLDTSHGQFPHIHPLRRRSLARVMRVPSPVSSSAGGALSRMREVVVSSGVARSPNDTRPARAASVTDPVVVSPSNRLSLEAIEPRLLRPRLLSRIEVAPIVSLDIDACEHTLSMAIGKVHLGQDVRVNP